MEPRRAAVGCIHSCESRYPPSKRVLDLSVAVIAMVAALPVLALLAVAVQLDSTGSPIFTQWRIGRGGKPFRIYKLRTMRAHREPDGEDKERERGVPATALDQGAGLYKSRSDPRVTRVGALLRRSSLDELPQILNVLWGDMSLVGPRPHTADDVVRFPPGYLSRHALPPGMTGLWQISGRNKLSTEEMLELDVRYVATWSLAQDLRILFSTPVAVLRTSNAA